MSMHVRAHAQADVRDGMPRHATCSPWSFHAACSCSCMCMSASLFSVVVSRLHMAVSNICSLSQAPHHPPHRRNSHHDRTQKEQQHAQHQTTNKNNININNNITTALNVTRRHRSTTVVPRTCESGSDSTSRVQHRRLYCSPISTLHPLYRSLLHLHISRVVFLLSVVCLLCFVSSLLHVRLLPSRLPCMSCSSCPLTYLVCVCCCFVHSLCFIYYFCVCVYGSPPPFCTPSHVIHLLLAPFASHRVWSPPRVCSVFFVCIQASSFIASHRIASHRITSHHIASHHIPSHRLTSHMHSSVCSTFMFRVLHVQSACLQQTDACAWLVCTTAGCMCDGGREQCEKLLHLYMCLAIMMYASAHNTHAHAHACCVSSASMDVTLDALLDDATPSIPTTHGLQHDTYTTR